MSIFSVLRGMQSVNLANTSALTTLVIKDAKGSGSAGRVSGSRGRGQGDPGMQQDASPQNYRIKRG